jgi:hypothetical protein
MSSFAVGNEPIHNLARFVAQWRREIRRHAISIEKSRATRQLDLWEGHTACQELNSAGLLSTAMLEDTNDGANVNSPINWRLRDPISLIVREVAIYERYRSRIVLLNREMATSKRSLAKVVKELTKLRTRSNFPPLQQMLTQRIAETNFHIAQIDDVSRILWETPYGVWGRVLNEPKHLPKPYREMDLDTRFQIRVAKLLKSGLFPEGKVSLQTIGRLVLLVYLAAGLLEPRGDKAILLHSKRELKVEDIVQRLRRAAKTKAETKAKTK